MLRLNRVSETTTLVEGGDMTSHEELMVWMGSNRPQLLAPDTDIATDIPPGWIHLAKKATGALDKWMPNADEAPIAKLRSIAVREGRLEVAVEQGDEEVRGVIDAIRAMSGEICDRCAGKGDPVEDATGETGSRCRTCRSRGLRVCPRDWPVETVSDHPHLISPGQWTQDIRGGMTGADWDDSDWRNYGRLETVYAQPMAALMRAEDDVEAMRFWTGTPGWGGLLRALFVTLRPEQDERTDEPGHVPWRLRWIKEKWGSLHVRTTRGTPYQRAVVRTVEAMSGVTCDKCGLPGEVRWAQWVRPECDACWASASDEDRACAARWVQLVHEVRERQDSPTPRTQQLPRA